MARSIRYLEIWTFSMLCFRMVSPFPFYCSFRCVSPCVIRRLKWECWTRRDRASVISRNRNFVSCGFSNPTARVNFKFAFWLVCLLYSYSTLVTHRRFGYRHTTAKCRLTVGDLYLGPSLLPQSTWTRFEVIYILSVATPRFRKYQ